MLDAVGHPRLAWRLIGDETLESNGAVGARWIHGGHDERRGAPAVLTEGPAADEHDRTVWTLEALLQQSLMSDPGEGHDAMTVDLPPRHRGDHGRGERDARHAGVAQSSVVLRDQPFGQLRA